MDDRLGPRAWGVGRRERRERRPTETSATLDARRSTPVSLQSLYACVYLPAAPIGEPDAVERKAPALVAPAGLVSVAEPSPASAPLVQLAEEFSPRYEQPRPDLAVIDLRGLERLLGTPRTIGEEIRREAADRGLRVHVAVAGTRIAATVLALARPGMTVVAAGGEADALSGVPLRLLDQIPDADPVRPARFRVPGRRVENAPGAADDHRATASAVDVLRHWGIRTLGELAALPAADLVSRLGARARQWQAIARGEDVRPLVPLRPEERFDASIDLEWPIEGLEPLSFVLTRLLEPLSTRLERHDRGTAVLHTSLHLVSGERHDRSVQLPSPLREVRALRTLALLDLESHPPSGAIDRVAITIDPTPGRICQHTLFTRPHPTPEQLSTLVARLNALLGQDRVGAPVAVDSYRPGAFAMQPFAVDHTLEPRAPEPRALDALPIPDPRRSTPELIAALRRYRPPVPARVALDAAARPIRVTTDRRGYSGGMVVSSAGPWRTSGAWWEERAGRAGEAGGAGKVGDTAPADRSRRSSHGSLASAGGWDREEWDVALADGVVYRIFRDAATNGWFLDGQMD